MLKPIKLANKNFLSSLDTSSEEIFNILEIAKNFKNKDLMFSLENISQQNETIQLLFNPKLLRKSILLPILIVLDYNTKFVFQFLL